MTKLEKTIYQKKYVRTKRGLATRIYISQRGSSRTRGHDLYLLIQIKNLEIGYIIKNCFIFYITNGCYLIMKRF